MRLDPCDGRAPFTCALLDHSVTGMRLELPDDVVLPAEVHVLIGEIAHNARVVWRKANVVGVDLRRRASQHFLNGRRPRVADDARPQWRSSSGLFFGAVSRLRIRLPLPRDSDFASAAACGSVCFGSEAYHSFAAFARLLPGWASQ